MRLAPRPTTAEREAARAHAGGYLYRLDPDCDPDGRVPPEKSQGAWAVNAHGEIVGEFQSNPNYGGTQPPAIPGNPT